MQSSTDWLFQEQPRGLFNYLFNIKRNYQRSQRAGAKCKTRKQIKIRRGWEENKQLHLVLVLLDRPPLILRRGSSNVVPKQEKMALNSVLFYRIPDHEHHGLDRSPSLGACIVHGGISYLTAFLQTGLFLGFLICEIGHFRSTRTRIGKENMAAFFSIFR